MSDLVEKIRAVLQDAHSEPWVFKNVESDDGQEWFGCMVSSPDSSEFIWFEENPESDIPTATLIALVPEMARKVLAAEELAEIAEWVASQAETGPEFHLRAREALAAYRDI